MNVSEETWFPYVINGQAHPGVTVDAGMQLNDGARFIAKIEQGGHTIPHTHSGMETIEILEGTATIEVAGIEITLQKGAVFAVLPHTVHCVRNATSHLLLLRAVFDPPFHQQQTNVI